MLQTCWEGPYIIRINDVIYRIQQHPSEKIMVRPRGQNGTISVGYSGRVALRRQQCNRGQQRLLVWRPAKPLTSRLPEPYRARRENILRVSSAAWNSLEGSRNTLSAMEDQRIARNGQTCHGD